MKHWDASNKFDVKMKFLNSPSSLWEGFSEAKTKLQKSCCVTKTALAMKENNPNMSFRSKSELWFQQVTPGLYINVSAQWSRTSCNLVHKNVLLALSGVEDSSPHPDHSTAAMWAWFIIPFFKLFVFVPASRLAFAMFSFIVGRRPWRERDKFYGNGLHFIPGVSLLLKQNMREEREWGES